MAAQARRRREPVYTPIFAVYHKPQSGCEFFEVMEKEGYYLVYCKVLERFIPKEHVLRCENYWKMCPFRRIGLQMMEES